MKTRLTLLPLLALTACVEPPDADTDLALDLESSDDAMPAALLRAGVTPFTAQDAAEDPPAPRPEPGPIPQRPSEGDYLLARGATGSAWVPYHVVGDEVMLGDDIILGTVAKVLGDGSARALGVTDLSKRWDGNEVPWDADLEVGIPNMMIIDDTLARLEAALPITFVFDPDAPNRIHFKTWNETFGASAVGMVGGAQELKIQQSTNVRTVAHEVLHALGRFHEQQRSDRDDHVDYHEECAATPANFAPLVGELHLGPYDLASLMHYRGDSQCIKKVDDDTECECPTLTYPGTLDPLESPTKDCDQTADPICFLSDLDIGAMWTMYGDFTDDTAVSGDYLGWATAAGDFDGDGLDDIASTALGTQGWRGKVMTFKGSYGIKDGQWAAIDPGSVPWRVLRRSAFDTPAANDLFGMSLAAGDFDGDGFDDLAIGAPGAGGQGAVYLYRGSRTGLVADVKLTALTDGGNLAFTGADFGAALAVADLNNDGLPELVVGAPGDRQNVATNTCGGVYAYSLHGAPDLLARWNPTGTQCQADTEAGAALAGTSRSGTHGKQIVVGGPGADSDRGRVWVLGYANTPQLATQAHLTQSTPDVCSGGVLDASAREVGDRFGAALAAGTRGSSHVIAVGSPGENDANGRVDVLRYNTSCWLREATLTEAPLGVDEPGDLFGAALAIGELTGDAHGDLLIGAPGEAVGAITAGWMYTFKGTPSGFAPHHGFGQSSGGCTNGNGERFGQSIALADLDGNVVDLVVGAPGNQVSTASYAGSLFLWQGRGNNEPAAWRALSINSVSPYAQ